MLPLVQSSTNRLIKWLRVNFWQYYLFVSKKYKYWTIRNYIFRNILTKRLPIVWNIKYIKYKLSKIVLYFVKQWSINTRWQLQQTYSQFLNEFYFPGHHISCSLSSSSTPSSFTSWAIQFEQFNPWQLPQADMHLSPKRLQEHLLFSQLFSVAVIWQLQEMNFRMDDGAIGSVLSSE